ncbi:hypothetical protein M422DRAFT_248460 [Sphaerobolus stellatus SS14]|uniref:Uncharacterized protein n=1 Tax=Sphaerobolus stellatus (strain SS14) TaxID=990650 RepID=A0A0C9VIT0_SPHS4|nr:hypothetical protein M422DRAFT_248460 [Sphaerobolus stellatus SS14]
MSLVPGAMHSFQYDTRSMVALELFEEHGIFSRDRLPTYYLRVSCVVVRASGVQKRTLKAHDEELKKAYTQISKLQEKKETQRNTLKRPFTSGKEMEPAAKRLQMAQQIEGLRAGLWSLQDQSSGRVSIPPSVTALDTNSVESACPVPAMTAGTSISTIPSLHRAETQNSGHYIWTPTTIDSNFKVRCIFQI